MIRLLVSRALVLFLLITVAVTALRINSPIGVVILVTVLGWVDIVRRRESMFWGNLGYSVWQTTGVMAFTACMAQLCFTTLVHPFIQTFLRNRT